MHANISLSTAVAVFGHEISFSSSFFHSIYFHVLQWGWAHEIFFSFYSLSLLALLFVFGNAWGHTLHWLMGARFLFSFSHGSHIKPFWFLFFFKFMFHVVVQTRMGCLLSLFMLYCSNLVSLSPFHKSLLPDSGCINIIEYFWKDAWRWPNHSSLFFFASVSILIVGRGFVIYF